MNFLDFQHLCQQRRSIRSFADKPVTKEIILALLAAGNLAPSVENTQPWHFDVVLEENLRAKLMETSCYGHFIEGAGALLIVTCDRTSKPTNQQIIWNPKELEYSCAIALSYVNLGATAMGLGSCWISLHHGRAHDLLQLPDHRAIIGGLIVGHLREGEEGVGHERRPVENTYTLYA